MNPRSDWDNLTRPLAFRAPYPLGQDSHPEPGTAIQPDLEMIHRELMDYEVTVGQGDQDFRPLPEELRTILSGIRGLTELMRGKAGFCYRLQGVEFRIRDIPHGGYGQAHAVTLKRNAFDAWTVVHELSHAWDGVNGWQLSSRMQKTMRAGYQRWWYGILHSLWPTDERFWYYPGGSPPPCGIDQNFNAKEDFAEAVTASVFPEEAKRRAIARGWPYTDPARGYIFPGYANTPRGMFIKELLVTT